MKSGRSSFSLTMRDLGISSLTLAVSLAGALAYGEVSRSQAAAPTDSDSATAEAAGRDGAANRSLAESILAQREAAMGRALSPAYRARISNMLASRSTDSLRQLQALAEDGHQPSLELPGDSSADLTFTPVTPCRVFDTRSAAAGILVGNTQRNFFVAGNVGFAGQGGNAAGCGIPLGPATSVVINFAAVTPAGAGNLRAWAVATPQPAAPLAAVMNYSPTLAALANGIVVPICDSAVTTCPSDLRLQADVSSVHVVGDVVGYFSSFQGPGGSNIPIAYGYINSDGTVANATSNVTSSYDAPNNRYVITIAGESYFFSSYVTVVTVLNQDRTVRVSSVGGNLLVLIRDLAAAPQQSAFQFVTFKP
jgi:hypothetical protein